jgi:hypothetical protein
MKACLVAWRYLFGRKSNSYLAAASQMFNHSVGLISSAPLLAMASATAGLAFRPLLMDSHWLELTFLPACSLNNPKSFYPVAC